MGGPVQPVFLGKHHSLAALSANRLKKVSACGAKVSRRNLISLFHSEHVLVSQCKVCTALRRMVNRRRRRQSVKPTFLEKQTNKTISALIKEFAHL